MKRDLFLSLLALALLGGGVGYALLHGETSLETSLPPTSPFTEESPYYKIVANYPTSTPLRASLGTVADEAARTRMQTFISEAVTEFKQNGDFENLTAKDKEVLGFDQGRQWSLQIAYLYGITPQALSYIFTIYEDTGGAHGNTAFRTFVFNTTTGSQLMLADLFVPGAPYLDRLSTLARAKLPGIIGEHADATFITEGTKPTEDSFRNFFFDNKMLMFAFPPYQVGPYALGPITLPIPTSELKDILRPEYQ